MTIKSLVSPDDQGATFVELFFDLVFVFAITQVTHYAAHHLDVHGVLRSLVIFWLIWWGWTQFTWALNAADTEHHHVRVGTLLATGVAFVMAVSLEKGFSPDVPTALQFAGAYILVRVIGLILYYKVTFSNEGQRAAVRAFATLSLLGLAAVLVGALVHPDLRDWFWVAAAVLDITAALVVGSRGEWGVHPGHFAERHGLILIIALGESLIVAGSALTGDLSASTMLVGALAVLLTFLLWWSYFGWIQKVLEERLEESESSDRTRFARDVFTLLHFPVVVGVIAAAVALEAGLHPDDYTLAQVAGALAAGLTLFLGATAVAMWRASGCVLGTRIVILGATLIGLIFAAGTSVPVLLGIACMGLLIIVGAEEGAVRRRYAPR